MEVKIARTYQIFTVGLILLSMICANISPDRFIAWFLDLTIRTGFAILLTSLNYLIIPKHKIYLRWVSLYLIVYFVVFSSINNYIEIYGSGDSLDFIVLCLKIAYGMAIAITMIIVRIKARKLKEEGLFR